jgi:hypothetical protein
VPEHFTHYKCEEFGPGIPTRVLMVLSDFRRPTSCCLFLKFARRPRLAVVKSSLALDRYLAMKRNQDQYKLQWYNTILIESFYRMPFQVALLQML